MSRFWLAVLTGTLLLLRGGLGWSQDDACAQAQEAILGCWDTYCANAQHAHVCGASNRAALTADLAIALQGCSAFAQQAIEMVNLSSCAFLEAKWDTSLTPAPAADACGDAVAFYDACHESYCSAFPERSACGSGTSEAIASDLRITLGLGFCDAATAHSVVQLGCDGLNQLWDAYGSR